MEGMDLWTSMFTTDFEEGDDGDRLRADEFMDEDDEAEHEADLDEADDDGDGLGLGLGLALYGNKAPDLDDDAIFDFELEPIVNIAEPQTAAETELEPEHEAEAPTKRANRRTEPLPTVPTAVRGMPRKTLGHVAAAAAVVQRPTTSQINATDEHGVPINYELGVIYRCPACGSEYRQQDMWKRHMNQMHHFNTRRGLNFVAIDKLYHRCLECNKRIAMHSRENLLKHKFTHLPYRCTKCYICKREYKYRQDLMVHLRMVHCDEVVAMMRAGDDIAGRKTRVREKPNVIHQYAPPAYLNDDNLQDRNAMLEPAADDYQCRISAGNKKRTDPTAANDSDNNWSGATEFCEDYIHYMCPDCGTECDTHAQWSQHIEFVHDYVSRRGLNFRCVDMQMQCLECKEMVIPNTIKTLRAHKFSHLPQSEWMRCKLCFKGYKEHHELVTHLLKQHHLESLVGEAGKDSTANANAGDDIGDKNDEGDGYDDDLGTSFDDARVRLGRIGIDDMFEPHIDYLCPQCGNEFIEKKHWRSHVVKVHGMNDLAKLNFEVINDRQLKCTECEKIITNAYGIQNAQQHRITHLPFKAYARCRKCHKSYTDRKGLVKHLATYHRVGYELPKVSGGAASAAVQPAKLQPQRKQIVTVANETYEIIYLDEEQSTHNHSNNINNEENDFGEQMQADDDDYAIGSTQTTTASCTSSSNYHPAGAANPNRYKCVDCGTLFATQAALKTHISEEHDFMDTQYSAKKFDNAEPTDELTTDLVVAETSSSSSSSKKASTMLNNSGASTIEQNYIFLCPACGDPYKTQFEWRRHINEAHNFDKRQSLNMRQLDKYRYQCIHCKDIVCNSKLKGLQDHHFRHLPYRLYLKCLVCGTCYNHKPNIAAHLRTRHNIYERDTSWRELKPQSNYLKNKEKERERERNKEKDMDNEMHAMSTSSLSPTYPTSSGSAIGRSLKPQAGVLPTRPPGLNTLEDSISYHNAVDLDFITYFCPQCNKNFNSHAFWRKHIVEQHNFNSRQGLNFRQIDNHHYLCLECYKRVTVTHTKGAIGQLQSHKFRHLPYRSFKCLTCNDEFVRKQMFFKHLNRDTNRCDNKQLIEFDNDNNDIAEQSGSLAVEEVDPAAYRLMCPQCGDEFKTSSKALWREHINIHHGLGKREMLHMQKVSEQLFRCTDCDEKLQTKKLRVLQQHRFRHLPYAGYIRCRLCENQADGLGHGAAAAGLHSMRELQQHMRDQHPDENVEQMQLLLDDEDSQPDNNGPYMPLPPHLYDDDGDDVQFEDQYLLG